MLTFDVAQVDALIVQTAQERDTLLAKTPALDGRVQLWSDITLL